MAVQVILEIDVKPEKLGDLKEFMSGELHHTRGFDGCDGLTVHTNLEEPTNLILVENWESREHYEKYLAWRTERGDMERLAGWVTGEPSIRYFNNFGV